MSAKQTSTWFLVGLGAIAIYLCYRIAEPFLSPLFVAVVLAVVFFPLHGRIHARVRGPNAAAALSTLVVILVMVVPALFVGIIATRELHTIYQSVSVKSATEGGLAPYLTRVVEAPLRVIGRYLDVSEVNIRSTVAASTNQASRYFLGLGAKVVGNVFDFVLRTVVVFFTLFYLFRDGRDLFRQIKAALPLAGEKSTRLMTRIYDAIIATANGGIAVTLIQAALNGLGFWLVGMPAPALWGLTAGVASLIPVVGTALVWTPAAAALLLAGHWIKALILVAWELARALLIDTVIRPRVISGRARIPNLLLFFALLGGVKAFGVTGLFLGPVVVAMTIAVSDLLREQTAAGQREAPSATAA